MIFDFEKDLYGLLSDLYRSLLNYDRVYPFELPLNYNYKKNKIGIYYTINTVNDNDYKNITSIDVNFYCLEHDKLIMLDMISKFDKNLNKKEFNNYWLTHKNVWLITLKEDNLYHYVLSYDVNQY